MWKKIGSGKSSICYKKNNIVKKCYKKNDREDSTKRMCNEINALTLLKKYKYFPKIIKIDWENLTIYMNYVGICIYHLPNKYITKTIFYQLKQIEKALKKKGIKHTDIHRTHIMLYKDTVSLIDFEKVIIDEKIKTIYPKYIRARKNKKYSSFDSLKSSIMEQLTQNRYKN